MALIHIEKSAALRRAPQGGLDRFKGGQFIDAPLWESEKQKAKAALPDLLDDFGERLQFLRSVYEQNAAIGREGVSKVKLVPLTTIEAQMKAAVRESYAKAFLLGKRAAGNLTSATEPEQSAVKRLRTDEFKYLRGFLSDLRDDSGVMDYGQRMSMYQMAAREIFNLGFVLGNLDPKRRLKWVCGATEHCADCLRFQNMGAMSALEFKDKIVDAGYLPQSGKLACLGYRCQCSIEEC